MCKKDAKTAFVVGDNLSITKDKATTSYRGSQSNQSQLSKAEQKKVPYPSVCDLIEFSANNYKDQIAICDNERDFTYHELNTYTKQLTFYLKSQKISPHSRIIVCCPRSAELLICVWATLKLGCHYIPIEPDDPYVRIKYILEDSKANIIITKDKVSEKLKSYLQKNHITHIDFDLLTQQLRHLPTDIISKPTNPNDLVYIIYTSGSSGKPKGVMISNQNVFNYIVWFQLLAHFNHTSHILFSSQFSFDMAITESLTALAIGATITICDQKTKLNPSSYLSLIKKNQITHIKMTPSYFQALLSYPQQLKQIKSLKYIILGGEQISKRNVSTWLKTFPKHTVINEYGPTETTVATTAYEITIENINAYSNFIPIGKPAPHASAYVIREDQTLCDTSENGELFISGDHVAQGYLNNDLLTQEKFINLRDLNIKGYKTGDLVRKLVDGNIQFIGRIDDQVKINGVRIEPNEINATLQTISQIKESIILPKKTTNRQYLIAFVVLKQTTTSKAIMQVLTEKIPKIMLPAKIILLDTMPMLSNGKIDKQALLKIADQPQKRSCGIMWSSLEKQLATFWSEILEIPLDSFRPSDDFFSLGGQSIDVIRLLTKLAQNLSADITYETFHRHANIKALANYVAKNHHKTSPVESPPINKSLKTLPASSNGQRLWYLSKNTVNASAYYLAITLTIEGHFIPKRFQKAIKHLIARHSVLRSYFYYKGGCIYQSTIDINQFNIHLPIIDVSMKTNDEVEKAIITDAKKVFELEKGYLFRVSLYQLSQSKWIILFNMHHIITDAWSTNNLLHEVCDLYNKHALKRTACQFSEFIKWEQKVNAPPYLDEALSFWGDFLSEATLLNLPYDFPREETQYQGKQHVVIFEKELIEKLKDLSRQTGVTFFTTLLSAFQVLLMNLCQQEDIVLGTTCANRAKPIFENMLGFLANTIVLRSHLSGNLTFIKLLQKNKEMLANVFTYQSTPFDKVVSHLSPHRLKNKNPIFNVMITLDPENKGDLALDKCRISKHSIALDCAMFDLTLLIQPKKNHYNFIFEYNTQLFEQNTVRNIADYYRTLLENILSDPGQPVGYYPFLHPDQIAYLRDKWNQTDTPIINVCSFHQLFEIQVKNTPNLIALKTHNESFSYQQLNRKANQLAHYLKLNGIDEKMPIPIFIRRNVYFIIGVIAILKLGATYVPIDLKLSIKRILYIINDTQATIVLTQKSIDENSIFSEKKMNFQLLDILNPIIYQKNKHLCNLPTNINPTDRIYIIYTSGSTGSPKGVINTHQGLINCLTWAKKTFKVQEEDCVIGKTPFSFDVSFLELFLPLISGAKYVLANKEDDLTYLAKLIEDNSVTIGFFVPSMLEAFLHIKLSKILLRLRLIVSTGDNLSNVTLNKYLSNSKAKIYNCYGPTENAIESSYWLCNSNYQSSTSIIGKPIDNIQLYVLDKHLKLTPINVPGELYIGGIGLAECYLNQKELTNSSFIYHSFAKNKTIRLYKTGDLVKRLPNGNLAYLGRIDNQVKINGIRIELEEIEHCIKENPNVAQAVVIANTNNRSKHLLAFITKRSDIPNEEGMWNKQVKQWQQAFQHTYQRNITNPICQDTVGWNSSFTDKPIADIEMKEWLDNTIKQILAFRPKRVLEIGCGTGMILFKVAPFCESYMATDFSHHALQSISTQLDEKKLKQVSLKQSAADKLDLATETYDLIVINSVVQYFPSLAYLNKLLHDLLPHLQKNARIFIGDVRNFEQLTLFHQSVQLEKSTPNTSYEQWQHNVQRAIQSEEELLIAPAFFETFALSLDNAASVEILLKPGKYHNEMNLFRYDVIIHLSHKRQLEPAKTIFYNNPDTPNINSLRESILEASQNSQSILIEGIPHPSLQFLNNQIEIIQRQCQLDNTIRNKPESIAPYQLEEIAKDFNYSVKATPTKDGLYYNALLYPSIQNNILPVKSVKKTTSTKLANDPLQAKSNNHLIETLHEHIRNQLPSYMQPAQIFILEHLPCNHNGKLDRKALENYSAHQHKVSIKPATPTEIKLAHIWKKLLNLQEIDSHDNFFRIGGNSLLIIELLARIKKTFNLELQIKHIFEYPSLTLLSAKLDIISNEKYSQHRQTPCHIMQLQQGSKKQAPLFLFHPITGMIFEYEKLTYYLPDKWPIYAIENIDLNLQHSFSSLQEMAQHYIKQIKAIHPYGKYYLAGASFGGNLAIEIAQQLISQGDTVLFVGLFDSWAKFDTSYTHEATFKKQILKQHTLYLNTLEKHFNIGREQWLKYMWHNMQLLKQHKIKPIHFTIHLFKASKNIDIPDNHWQAYSTKAIITHKIPGDHYTMMHDPNLKVLAEKLTVDLALPEKAITNDLDIENQ